MQLSLSEALPTGGARQELGITGRHSPDREPHVSGDLSLSPQGQCCFFLEASNLVCLKPQGPDQQL